MCNVPSDYNCIQLTDRRQHDCALWLVTNEWIGRGEVAAMDGWQIYEASLHLTATLEFVILWCFGHLSCQLYIA